tara:strand:+ start:149 stop:538 length:390 start_codon:yes stop_codon:yes gene_type:complete
MPTPVNQPLPWEIALSAETGALEAGTGVISCRVPYAMALTQLPRISVTTAPTGSTIIVDINAGATSPATILSTKLSIDVDEKTSVSASSQGVLSTTTLGDNDILNFDIDQIGSSESGVALKIIMYGTRL